MPIRILLLCSFLALAACDKDDTPTDAPTNVSVTTGEALVAISWDEEPGLDYWIFYKAGSTVSLDDYDLIEVNVSSPAFIARLDNGTQYAFSVTSRLGNSPVGPFSAPITSTPRLIDPSIPWNIATALTAVDLNGVAYGNNLFVTVGDASTIFYGDYDYLALEPTYATLGISSWNQPATQPTGAGTDLVDVIYDGVRFVALASDGAISVANAGELTTWTAGSSIGSTTSMRSIAVGAGRYVAVGDGGAIYYTSADGASGSWTSVTPITANDLYGVRFALDRFVAVGAAGTLLTSTDGGSSWTNVNSDVAANLRNVVYGDRFVAVGDAGSITSSDDGVSWSAQTSPTMNDLYDVIFATDGQYIAVGSGGTVAYSVTAADGSWSVATEGAADLRSIASNFLHMAVGVSGTNLSTR